MRKREQTLTLNFFLGLMCFSAGWLSLTPSLERTPQKIGDRELSSPYIWCSTDVCTLSLFAVNFRKTTSCPFTSALCQREGRLLPFAFAHAYNNFGPPFSLVIFNYHKYLGLAIRRLYALFIHLIFYEPFNCITVALPVWALFMGPIELLNHLQELKPYNCVQ